MDKLFVPLVRTSAVLPVVRFLQEAGAPVDRYLASAKLSPDIVDRPEALLPFHQVLDFAERAAASEQVEALGFLVGEKTEFAELGAFGCIVRQSATLSSALATLTATINCYNSGDRIWLLPDDDPVLLCHAFIFPDASGVRHGNLYTIMLLIKLVRLAIGATWWPRELRLPRAETVRRKTYEALFPARVVFHDLNAYALVLDRPLLACAMAGAASAQGSLRDDVSFLRSTAPAPDFCGSLRQAISGLLRDGYPDVRLVADIAGMSVRTFQRRLAVEGASYRGIVEQARFEMAARLLRDDGPRLIDIAYELGYADPANFTRAFKHWAGMTPSEYRRLAVIGAIPTPPASEALGLTGDTVR